MAQTNYVVKNPEDLKKYSFLEQFKDSWRYSEGHHFILISALVLSFLAALFSIIPSFLYGQIITSLSKSSFANIYLYLGAMIICYFLYAFVDRSVDAIIYLNNFQIRRDSNIRFYNHIFRLNLDFFEKASTGNVMSQINSGTSDLAAFNKVFYRKLIMGVFIFISSLVSLILLKASEVAIIGIISVILYQLWAYFTNIKKIELEYLYSLGWDKSQGKIMDYLSRIQLVKTLNIKDKLLNTLRRNYSFVYKAAIKSRNFMNRKVFVEKVLIRIPNAVALLFLAISFMKGEIEIGAIVTAYVIFSKCLDGYVTMQDNYSETLNTRPGMFKLRNLLKNQPTIEEPKNPKKPANWNEISFNNVRFAYSEKEKLALENVSFKIKKGEKLAIVGLSGSGKSTISKLLLRIYDPLTGKIKIGDLSLKEISFADIYNLIKVVPQENELIDTTIYNNLKLGTSKNVAKEEIINALKSAQALDFVKKLPKGINTLVGTNGIKLSGGEKQRICIARALLSNPKVLVLDEATSHLDVITERKVHDELHKLEKDKTIVAITHRISSMYLFDRIIVINEGRIIGEGTHDYLLKTNSIYQRLWRQSKKL
jgi:ABC-type bacteriocin/lantibiotic exporter with double-glycine peptidase domain